MRKRVLLLLAIGACFCLCLSGQACSQEGDDVTNNYYQELEDADGDGHYALGSLMTPNDDCNDFDPDVFPGATEQCSFTDNDCDGMIDEGCPSTPGMAYIPGGCFEMGDAFNEGAANELPVHTVCISSFEMDSHEVTNAEYKECVDAAACTAPSDSSSDTRGSYYGAPAYDDYPVIYVNWNQATAYCAWAGKLLPTEAEWEYAARGGLSGNRYPWGDSIGGTDANYLNSGDAWDNDTSPVGNYAANGYGLYDVSGNVWEWVNDWSQSDYYSVSPTNDPPGPASGTARVFRAGGWHNGPYALRVAYRPSVAPTSAYYDLGFRCARD